MKKHLLMAVAAAMLVSSCSKNEMGDSMESTKSPIGFSTYVGTTTKATDLLDATFLEFETAAYRLASEYVSGSVGEKHFDLLKVTRTASNAAWTAELKQWPTDSDKLNFFAFAPSKAAGTKVFPLYTKTGDVPTLTYEPTTTVANQSDVVVAHSMNLTSATAGGTASGAVKLSFKHALTKIQFAVTCTDAVASTLEYTITKIEVTDVLPKGVFTFATDGTAVGTWVASETLVAYSYFSDNMTVSTTATTPITGTDGSLMLIPQGASTINVAVTYSTTTEAIPVTKSVALSGTWTSGQNLRYNLKLSSTTPSNDITFETETLPGWDTEESKDITPAL